MSTPGTVTLVPRTRPHTSVRAPEQAVGLAGAVLEAMMGRRPLHQLRPHLTVQTFRTLARHADATTLRRGRILRLRAQMPAERAVEAWASVQVSGRVVSCVLRLDVVGGAWRCTDLSLLTPAWDDAA